MDVHRAPVESRHKGTTKIAHTQIKNTPKVVFSNLSHVLSSFISGVRQTPLFVSFFAFQVDIIHRSFFVCLCSVLVLFERENVVLLFPDYQSGYYNVHFSGILCRQHSMLIFPNVIRVFAQPKELSTPRCKTCVPFRSEVPDQNRLGFLPDLSSLEPKKG
ncbi:MAG: hypothetical protein IKO26_07365 [Paludibacteraceae bacterium]|nr:hypothetical protein [Paludibacteraceae bacterium]